MSVVVTPSLNIVAKLGKNASAVAGCYQLIEVISPTVSHVSEWGISSFVSKSMNLKTGRSAVYSSYMSFCRQMQQTANNTCKDNIVYKMTN